MVLETTTEELKALKNAIHDKGVDKTVDDLLSVCRVKSFFPACAFFASRH